MSAQRHSTFASQALAILLALNAPVSLAKEEIPILDWLELMPKSDQEALAALPPVDHIPIADFDEKGDLVFERPPVFSSKKTVPELAGRIVKIPGFVVPVESDGNMRITEFFLVPYFGACIHVPPPPPNQIIYVKYPKGFKTDIIADPFLITGKLSIENIAHDIAEASYSLTASHVEVYKE
jgi:hypothetical protein